MDPGSGLAILGTALGSAKVLEKILGPTADYLGAGIRSYTETRVDNVRRIFETAQRKLGSSIESEGQVPPKVLRDILEDGSYCTDTLSAEYFGGVLASSRSSETRDDRGATFTALIGRLTAYQIRAHYIIYSTMRRLYLDQRLSPTAKAHRPQMRTYLPDSVFRTAMDFSGKEIAPILVEHCLFGLEREWLIQNDFLVGTAPEMKQHVPKATEGGILVTPSAFGTELFLWVNGHGKLHPLYVFDSKIAFESNPEVIVQNGALPLRAAES